MISMEKVCGLFIHTSKRFFPLILKSEVHQPLSPSLFSAGMQMAAWPLLRYIQQRGIHQRSKELLQNRPALIIFKKNNSLTFS